MSEILLPAIDPNWIRKELAKAPHNAGTVTIPRSTWAAVLGLAVAHLRQHGQMEEVHPATHDALMQPESRAVCQRLLDQD